MFTLKGKKAYLLDVEKFKAKYGLEEKLSHLEWVEGACNYIGFLETLSDPGMAPLTCWKNHFGFFESCPDTIKVFPLMKSLTELLTSPVYLEYSLNQQKNDD